MLKPFFCYYGGKWRAAPRYPSPAFPVIIEPFAGAAGYSLRHYQAQVRLYDLDPVICGLWEYLIGVSDAEVLSLPLEVNHVDELAVCQEAKWLIGFWLNKGSAGPRLSPSSRMLSGQRPKSHWGEAIRSRIAAQVSDIRHWRVFNRPYSDADGEATWFIDPPYSGACGRCYRYRNVDYRRLADWCLSRQGQVIVCEQEGADWLPFKPLGKIRSNGGRYGKTYSHEVAFIR